MVDRYATNQFYNFGSYEENIKSNNNRQINDNPKFLWPRDYNKNAVNGKEGNFPANTIPVQRGYMRMITEAYGSDEGAIALGKRRLHFQFNPETLTRMVTARNDVQLWQNQDPFQFTQPIPGDANFSFELMFNREAEVASASYRDENGQVVKSNKAAQFSRTIKTKVQAPGHPSLAGSTRIEDNPYDQSWVTDIGVLADLMVFDQIIGQGMNKDLIDKIVAKAEATTKAYNTALSSKGDTADVADKQITFEYDKAATYLGTNIGNSAFLVAQPIRVVFSSSFMVEGFVSSTNVIFNKFNASMVPTQCIISVQMQAMYIGFANKDTYLTQLFKEYKPSTAFGVSSEEEEASNKALKEYGNALFTKFENTNAAVDLFKYNLNPERIFNNDGDGQSQLEIKCIATENLKTFAKNNAGTLSASLRYIVTYMGRAGGGTGGGFVPNEEVYRETVNADFDMSSLKNGIHTIKFKINNPVYKTAKPWDTADTAKYKIEVVMYYHIVGAAGGDVYANQVATANNGTKTWKEVWRLASALKTATYTDDQIQEIVDAA